MKRKNMLQDTGLPTTILSIKYYNKYHIPKYKKFVELIDQQLDILIDEFTKFPNHSLEKIEDSRNELNMILDDFDVEYIRPIDSDSGTKPFDSVRGLLPKIDQYL